MKDTSAIEAISFCIESNIDGNKIKEQSFIPSKKGSRLALSYRNAIALLPVILTKMHCDYWGFPLITNCCWLQLCYTFTSLFYPLFLTDFGLKDFLSLGMICAKLAF